MKRHSVTVGGVAFDTQSPFGLIAGPCQIESADHCVDVAGHLAEICRGLGRGFVFKASFDKANRSSVRGGRGVGMEKGLWALAEVKRHIGCPVTTDVHEPWQCRDVSRVVDIIQVPAFLCRQTDLLATAGHTGKAVNIKKGQFMAPWDMANAAEKVRSTGNHKVMLTERGTCFGYNTLVNDFRALPQMADLGYPVVFDATHSVQQPGGLGFATGGDRRFVPHLARAAVAVGVAGVFIETHEDPDLSASDGPNMVPLDQMAGLMASLDAIERAAQ